MLKIRSLFETIKKISTILRYHKVLLKHVQQSQFLVQTVVCVLLSLDTLDVKELVPALNSGGGPGRHPPKMSSPPLSNPHSTHLILPLTYFFETGWVGFLFFDFFKRKSKKYFVASGRQRDTNHSDKMCTNFISCFSFVPDFLSIHLENLYH